MFGAVATGAATSSAVIQQIKPKEYEQGQRLEESRRVELKVRRKEIKLQRLRDANRLEHTGSRPTPWRSIGVLAALVGAVGGLVMLSIWLDRPPPQPAPPAPPVAPSPPPPPHQMPPPPPRMGSERAITSN